MLKFNRQVNHLLKHLSLFSLILLLFHSGTLSGQTIITDFVSDEEEIEEAMEEFWEKMHAASPGTNWQMLDQKTREDDYKDYLKAVKKKSANLSSGSAAAAASALTESFANGKLTGTWNEKGPSNMAGNNNYADYVASTNTVYTTSAGGNVWKGNLDGSNWTCLNNFYKFTSANFIKVIPNGTSKRIFVSTGDKYAYYSDNDGVTWQQSTGLSSIQSWGWIMKTEMLADAGNTIFFIAMEWPNGPQVSVYRSTDKGTSFTKVKSWNTVYDNNQDQNKYTLWAPSNVSHNLAYVVTPDSVFSIPNTGSSVQRLAKHNLTITNDVHFGGSKSGSSIYFYLYSNNNLYRSTNSGASWLTLNRPSTGGPARTYSLTTGLNDPNRIYFGDAESYSGVFSTSTNQVSWTKVNGWYEYYSDMAHKLHADISLVGSFLNTSNAEFQLICTDGGIYSSTNYLSTVNNITLSGMNNAQYYSVYTVRNNPNYIYTGSQDQGFQEAVTDPGGILNVSQLMSGDDGRTVSTDNNSFWHTSYAGLSYYPAAQNSSSYAGYDLTGVGRLWMPFITEHPTNGSIAYMGGGTTSTDNTVKIYQFSYSGGIITKTSLPFDFAPLSQASNISSIAISKINSNYWYVLTDNGKFFYSTNGGSSFTMNTDPNFAGLTGQYFYGSSIYASKLNLGTIYIAGSGYSSPGVYKSTNHGQTFTPITTGLPGTLVYDIAVNDNETMVFAATEVGPYVYVVADNMWYSMKGTTGTDQLYWDVEYISQSSKVRFATYGRGVWDFNISNLSPSVSITSPANNASFTAPASITINATASDNDGTVSKVEFFQGSTKLGEDLTSPYSFTWTNVAAGTYALTAKATDNLGALTTSAAVTITVTGSSNHAPSISISSPVNNASFTAPASITINATASDNDGTVSKVEFFQGSTKLGEDLSSPYSFTWTNVATGTYTLSAKATDNLGAITTSAAVNVTVTGASNCLSTEPSPNPSLYIVRNDWSDQNAGSGVSSLSGALKITHRAYGENYLWLIESGKTFNIVSGQTYTIQFDFKDFSSYGVSSINAGFATGYIWSGPNLAQPVVTVPAGYSSSAFTTKTVSITATYTGTVSLVFKLNWAAQPTLQITDYIQNISVCGASGSARMANAQSVENQMMLSAYPNPASEMLTVKINLEEASDVKVAVFTSTGVTINSFSTALNKGENELPISVSDLVPGEYMITLRSSGGTKMVRFIKQ